MLVWLALWALSLGALGCGPGFDKYDDSIRGTHQLVMRVSFGQRIGPDGDGCWLEDARVYCDLISIDLHWDAGEVEVLDPVDILMGSGYLCVIAEDGVRCWEWGSDVQPRRSRAPEGTVFGRLSGAGGFVCGQSADFRRVVCWSIGVDRTAYRESTHAFDDGPERVMSTAYDDPPRVHTHQRETGRSEHFHPFLGRPERRPLAIETTP